MEESNPRHIDIEVDLLEFKHKETTPEVIQILSEVRPGWPVENIRCKIFTEGISNQLHGYYEDGKFEKDVVLIRVNGENTEQFSDREKEKRNILLLNKMGFCAPLYCSFKNGICYEFVHGVTLDVETVRDKKIKRLIAKELCKLHAVQFEGVNPKADFFDILQQIIDALPESYMDEGNQARYKSSINLTKADLIKEYLQVKTHLETFTHECGVVFSHNDLLLKNIIYTESEDKVTFIDYEFSTFNYQPFDIAIHFCEHAGVDEVDFKRYPAKDYQLDWLRYYLECWEEQHCRPVSLVTDRDVEKWYAMVNKFALVGHLYFAFWSLVQIEHSSIDFDFLGYAKVRLDEYYARKEEFLGLQLPS